MLKTKNVWLNVVVVVLFGLLLMTVPAMAQVHVTIAFPGGSAVHDPAMLEQFIAENPDIEVEALIVDWSEFLDEKLPTMFISGTAPDVWYGEAGRALGWSYQGMVADLGPFVERDLNLQDYFFLDAARAPDTGAWTAIPSDFQVTALFYNTNHFANQGIPSPTSGWTIDEFVDAARKLTVQGSDRVERYGIRLLSGEVTLFPRLLGGRILNESRTESRLTDPETVAGFEFMRNLIHEVGVAPSPGTSGYSFTSDTYSMELNNYVRNATLLSSGFMDYDVAPLPTAPSGKRFTTAIPNAWMINAHSSPEAQEAAWRWIKFQIGEDAQIIRMSAGSGVPINRSVGSVFLSADPPPANRAVFLQSFDYADTLDENAAWDEYRLMLAQELNPMFEGEVSALEALTKAHERISALLKEYYP